MLPLWTSWYPHNHTQSDREIAEKCDNHTLTGATICGWKREGNGNKMVLLLKWKREGKEWQSYSNIYRIKAVAFWHNMVLLLKFWTFSRCWCPIGWNFESCSITFLHTGNDMFILAVFLFLFVLVPSRMQRVQFLGFCPGINVLFLIFSFVPKHCF